MLIFDGKIMTKSFMYLLDTHVDGSFDSPFRGSHEELGHLGLAFYSGLFSFSGW